MGSCCAGENKPQICEKCKIKMIVAKWGYPIGSIIQFDLSPASKQFLVNLNYAIVIDNEN